MPSYADYGPSVSAAYIKYLTSNPNNCRGGSLPADLTQQDLNFMDPESRLFHHGTILLSPGQYLKCEPMLRAANLRQYPELTILGDSLGYQFIDNPRLWQGQATLDAVLAMQEEFFDVATIVDIPSRITTKRYPEFPTFRRCLEITKENIAYFLKRRQPGAVKHLNVIQGQNPKQAMLWYEGVKEFDLEGWAYGGYCRLDFQLVLKLFLRMRDEQVLERAQHLHFLGTGTLSSALALTILKRGLEATLGRPMPITYDTSAPFRQAFENYQVYGDARYTPKSFTCAMHKSPRSRFYFESELPFPYNTSAVSAKLTCGDMCINNKPIQKHAWDTLSAVLASNHNLDTLTRSMRRAHQLMELERGDAAQHIPLWLLEMKDVVPEILRSETPGRLLSQHKRALQSYCSNAQEEDEDF